MIRLAAQLGLVLALGTAAQAADADRPDMRGFAKRMIDGIGAQELTCRPEIVREIEAREMTVVCARFDGTFARFELRWDLELHERAPASSRPAEEPAAVHPLTEWEANGSQYERIYRVERKAVGVRFIGGDLLVVW